jgi:hypothetical protein
VANSRDSNREKFRIAWNSAFTRPAPPESETRNAVSKPMEIYVPPGQTRVFTAPKLPSGTTAGKLQLTGDEVDFDNQSFYAAPETEQLKIAWFGSESPNDPAKLRFYAERVFSPTPRRKVEFANRAAGVAPADFLNQATFAVIPGSLAPDEAAAVRDWLTSGETALLALSDAQTGPTLAALTGWSDIQVSEAGGDYALLGRIDFTHPLFAPFADPRFSDFSHIHFWKHRRVEFPTTANVRVLAKFDDGSPALAQVPVGKGTLLVLASGWNPVDSQFAVSSKFPPFMETLLDWSSAAAPVRFQYSTGDAIPSPWGAGILPASSESHYPAGKMPALPEVQWQKPDGKTVTLAAGRSFDETDLPGIYTANFDGRQRRFAVNLPLDESRTAPMSLDELAQLGVPLQTPAEFAVAKVPGRERHLQQAELENRQKLWRWLVLAALAVSLGEIVLSGRLARPVKTAEASV